ncbi:hypothetical protein [Bacillus sp. JCM 19034]|uniref:hypothetical protein n=1 Tax=Bacillus sp. JCM 19034 TaxID=1481928 RepID=UPI0007838F0B|nr:hypothetical protein [Bacillus sp. JCM 19034]
MDYGRKLFYLFGLFFGFMAVLLFIATEPTLKITYMFLAKMIMSFCLGYLYPQFKQQDERMKLIREKGVFASFFATMVYLLIFFILLQFEIIAISAILLIQLLSALVTLTVFLSFVIYSKIY